jgi:hypothetical protein
MCSPKPGRFSQLQNCPFSKGVTLKIIVYPKGDGVCIDICGQEKTAGEVFSSEHLKN